jgi:hypothetical protein
MSGEGAPLLQEFSAADAVVSAQAAMAWRAASSGSAARPVAQSGRGGLGGPLNIEQELQAGADAHPNPASHIT